MDQRKPTRFLPMFVHVRLGDSVPLRDPDGGLPDPDRSERAIIVGQYDDKVLGRLQHPDGSVSTGLIHITGVKLEG